MSPGKKIHKNEMISKIANFFENENIRDNGKELGQMRIMRNSLLTCVIHLVISESTKLN